MTELFSLIHKSQNVYASKTLVFGLTTGVYITAVTYTNREECRPTIFEDGRISNVCLSIVDNSQCNMCAIITLMCHPVPYVIEVDNEQASFLFKAILVSIDGIHIPSFYNNGPVMYKEYLHGNGETEHIMVMRNAIKQEICSALYIHAALTLDWISNVVKLVENIYESPRVMFYQGDENAKDQIYSGVRNTLSPWDIPTQKLRDIVKQNTGVYYNSALYNYYTDGSRYIAEHPDREAINSMIWGLTLGGARDFQFRRLADNKLFTFKLYHGDVIEMAGFSIQREWHHGVPKRAHAEPRISITMRWLGIKESSL